MNILICDDIREDALQLENVIKAAAQQAAAQQAAAQQAAAQQAGFEAHCICFDNGAEAFSYIQSGAKIDLCFLDIIMPQMKGTDLAFKIRRINEHMPIVFLTTSNEYAAEAFDVGAFNYMIKPPDTQKVKKTLNNIHEAQQFADTAYIPIITKNTTRLLLFKEISFIEVIQNKVYFRLLDGSEVAVYLTLNEIMPLLCGDERFAQCHRSYVVNMDAVSQIRGNEILLQCGNKVPISKSYKGFSYLYFKRGMGSDM